MENNNLNNNNQPRKSQTRVFLILAVIIIVAALVWAFSKSQKPANPQATNTSQAPSIFQVVQVVAAENFWGSLVSQIGGSHVQVLSIVSDPNADPHEYESNTEQRPRRFQRGLRNRERRRIRQLDGQAAQRF